jgi:hypothetical protein
MLATKADDEDWLEEGWRGRLRGDGRLVMDM